jgi:uncharacterized protein YjlB
LQIAAHGGFPNTSLSSQPIQIYRSAFLPPLSTPRISDHVRAVGIVEPSWVYTMYTESHFHSTTHELLIVLAGSALIQFGGPANPAAIETKVNEGDVMMIPAGVAHALLEEQGGFRMLGCYPVGAAQWDHCTATGERWGKEIETRIRALHWFKEDPIYGPGSPEYE